MDDLIRIPFPQIEDQVRSQRFYLEMADCLVALGYVYNKNFKFEWSDTGKLVPDYIWCDTELALVLKLKYHLNT
jgi:hypothetical protein